MHSKYKLIPLPKIKGPKGCLTVIENCKQIPFKIKRIYYLYDIPSHKDRGSHAHKKLHQFILAISGGFDIILNDGKKKKKFHLNRPYCGLYIPPMIWRELTNFSSGAVCLVCASEFYNRNDYIRNYNDFIKMVNKK